MMMRVFPEMSAKGVGFAVLRSLLLLYVMFGIVLYVRQDTLMYFPDQTPFADCPAFSDARQVSLSGTRGYFFQNGTSTKLAVLYHGNAGRACDRAYYRGVFERTGYSWLVVEYEGYAGDGKKPRTAGILRDVLRVADWVEKKKFSSVAIVGESIGTGAASYHAALSSPDRLVLLAPFDRLSLVAQEFYKIYPIRFMLKDDYDNLSWVRNAKSVLIIHGTHDDVIPFAHGKNLFDSLPQKDKKFVPLSGVDHNGAFGSGAVLMEIYHDLAKGSSAQ